MNLLINSWILTCRQTQGVTTRREKAARCSFVTAAVNFFCCYCCCWCCHCCKSYCLACQKPVVGAKANHWLLHTTPVLGPQTLTPHSCHRKSGALDSNHKRDATVIGEGITQYSLKLSNWRTHGVERRVTSDFTLQRRGHSHWRAIPKRGYPRHLHRDQREALPPSGAAAP